MGSVGLGPTGWEPDEGRVVCVCVCVCVCARARARAGALACVHPKAWVWICVWVHLLSLLIYICCLRILFLPLFILLRNQLYEYILACVSFVFVPVHSSANICVY